MRINLLLKNKIKADYFKNSKTMLLGNSTMNLTLHYFPDYRILKEVLLGQVK